MAKSSKDFAFKTTSGKDLEINLTSLKRTMKQKFFGKLKTSHSSASSTTLQPRNQFCHLPFFTRIIAPSFPPPHFTIHRGISNVPVMNLSFPAVKHPGKHQRKRWLWGIHSSVLVLPAPVGSVTAVLIQLLRPPSPHRRQRSELSFPPVRSWWPCTTPKRKHSKTRRPWWWEGEEVSVFSLK